MKEDLEEHLRVRARDLGASDARIISTETIIVAEWVRWKCQYGCRIYGTCLTCPPFSPTPQQTRLSLQGYSKALWVHGNKSFVIRYAISQLERESFLAGYPKVFGMGAGPCRLCESCAVPAPCRRPTEARPSLEACGIDVFQTAHNNGFDVHVLQDQEDVGNYFGLLLLE